MLARRLSVFALLLTACPSDTDGDTDGDTDSSSSTTAAATGTTAGTTNPSGTSGDATSSSTVTGSSTVTTSTSTSTTSTSTTGPGESSGSSSTGMEEVGSPGCEAAENLAEGEHQIMLDGFDRRYVVRLPQNYSNDRPWPLIFALHGNGGNPGYWDGTGGSRDIRAAFADEAIIIIPEAINNAWRDYDAGSETWPAGIVLELNFFDTVLETAENELCIDTGNVFSMGFSGGGSFSGVLGCQRDYIRAMAVGGSVIYFEEADCTESPASWITIGEGEFTDGRAAFRDFFVEQAGCEPTSMPGAPTAAWTTTTVAMAHR